MQGPFGGGLSTVELTAAVSNAGGLGGYGAYTLSPQEIVDINNKIRNATGKPYNINLWVSDTDAVNGTVTDEEYEQAAQLFKPYFDEAGIELPGKPPSFQSRYENQLQVILDIRPKLFSFTFGIPSNDVLEQCRRSGVKTAGAATTLDEAIALEEAGVKLSQVEFLASFPNLYTYRSVEYPVVDLFFTARVPTRAARPLDDVTEIVWRSPRELTEADLAFPSHPRALQAFLARK